ncbi:hypothetical protein H5V45_00770 [Nocardioides sp. KIGAM211]|uniref:Uncharacterized protein n=1 Tax=Nocardioides luti TaxID=2761101 RepID=A0A7X0RCQ6_9ACTN|nr:hypothetical protein [Nocardioides luti]MBB6625840.1 hypothetical protein [Nocardioides luti]
MTQEASEDDLDDDNPIRGEVRLAAYRRVSHGLSVPKKDGLTDEEEFLRDLRAYLLVLPEGAVFTHVTAARLLGWQLPKLPEQVPVFAAVTGDPSRPRRHGLICSRLVRALAPGWAKGLPVDLAEEILLRMARDLGLLDLVIVIDSARRLGHLDDRRMQALLESGRPGVRMLREAYALSCKKSDSGGESCLRLFHDCLGVAVEPQVDLYDEAGQMLGRADLLVTGTTSVHEYDGEHHRGKGQHRTDLRRERGWTGTAYVRRGFVLDDLLNHPAVAMHEIDRAVGRSHDLQRLARWRRLVDNSLYSERGRERVMNRWRRQTTLVDWSRTA